MGNSKVVRDNSKGVMQLNNRGKQLKTNTVVGLLSQCVTLICGFIVPKLILNYYGSEVNGLVSSITHFLSFISLAECGMGVVVQSSLYKPLAEHDSNGISQVIISAERFFRKIGILLIGYTAFLLVAYPYLIDTSFDHWYTAALIGAISISTFVQYFICMSYRLLLTADQRGYIQLSLNILTQIVNTILCVVIASCGGSIQILKLCASGVMLLQPLFLILYVRKHYSINRKISVNGEPIKQKWNGVAQHVAYVAMENTPTVVLTFCLTMTSVSVYNIYYLVVNGIKGVITSAVSGMQSLLGNMYAKNEKTALNQTFSYYEWVMHVVVVILYTCTAILIVPFVKVYTIDIKDTNYIFPLFGVLISMAQMLFCLRLPYNAMIFVAGHYKETQSSAWIETAINIVVSVALVFSFGLVGVAVGTLVAMIYRTIYLVFYLQKRIMMRPVRLFFKHIAIDIAVITLSFLATYNIHMKSNSYASWLLLALKVAPIVMIITALFNIIFYPDLFKGAILAFRNKNAHN